MGRPGSISYPDGGQTSYSYPSPTETTLTKLINASTSSVQSTTLDEFGRPSQILQSDPAGNDAVTYTYDENGRLSCITNPERSTTSSTDGKTCRSYDFLDRPVYVTQADENKMQFNYSGNQTNVTDENGHLRSYQYDAFHDLTATWEPDTTGALNWETLYGYDGASRLTSITQNGSNAAAARTRSFTYDSLGRMTGKTSPEAGTTSYTYDSNGNAITVKDARGITVTSSYDALNRITGKSSSDGSVGYGYTYDASAVGTGGGFPSKNPIGRLVEEANAAGPASNQYSYDSMGRIAVQANTLPSNCCSAATQTSNELHFAYDLAGDVSSVTYPDGRAVTYSYDSADHMTGVEYASWNGQAVNTPYLSDLSFEPTGQISAATFGNGVQLAAGFGPRQTVASLQYKNSSQTLWSKQYTWAANAQNLTQIVDATSSPQTYNYAYDPDNRLISAVGGGQTLVSPATSGRGSVSISGTERSALYTPPGCKERSCTSTVYNSGTVTLTVGNYSYSVDYGEGSTSTSVASALAAKISSTTNSPVAESYSGTTITLTATATGAATNYSLTTSATYNSTFFSSSSFTGTTSGAALTGGANAVYNGAAVLNETYTPDAWGNLQQSGNFSFIQGFGGNNQVSATGYNYDAAGNLLHDGLNNTYSYDGEGKLVSSSGATYVYDALGQRIKKVSGGSTTEYIYVNGQPIALLNPSTGAWTDLILGSGTILAEVAGSQTAAPLYRLSDHLGSVVVEANAAGSAVGSYLYTPYGQLMASSLSDPYAFTGLEQDIENGSDHAWARNYTLSQSRWMRPDPYDGSYDLMNPQSFNRYSYVNGNPLAFTDPSGLDGGTGGQFGGCVGAAESAGENVGDDLGCIGGALAFLFGFGGGPSFHGSLSPRPSTTDAPSGSWNDSFGVPYPGLTAGISQAAGLPGEGCEFGACGNSLTDYNQQQTSSQLQTAYNEVTAGRIIGLLNIKNHSCGECKYDYGWNSHSADTWNVCGQILNADQMGNFMAGYQSGVYDSYYFWTTGAIWAQGSVDAAGVLYHLTGRTKATSDPLDRTGMPDILRGQRYARHGCSGM